MDCIGLLILHDLKKRELEHWANKTTAEMRVLKSHGFDEIIAINKCMEI
jgi:hypothetical protein